MAASVGDFLLKRLAEWGLRRIVGYPGDGLNDILGAFGRFGPGLDFVQARHAELAAAILDAGRKVALLAGGLRGPGYAGSATAGLIRAPLAPDPGRPGLGLEFTEQEAQCFRNP